MIKRIATPLVAAAVLCLSACGDMVTTPAYKYNNTLIEPGKSLRMRCPVTPPPTKDAYMAADADERETLQTEYNKAINKDLANCNNQWDRLNSWYDQQEKLYPGASSTAIFSAPASGAGVSK